MADFERLAVRVIRSGTIGSIATDSSSYFPMWRCPATAQILSSYFINGTTSSATSGTTAGSSIAVNLYKNASSAGSVIASFSGSGTNVATLGSASLITSSTVNARLAAGDLLIAEVVGGAANNGSQAGAFIEINFIYGYQDLPTPTAGTGPA